MNNEADQTTELLLRIGAGDRAATDQLASRLYDELRRLAEAQLRYERPDHTLQPTALAHEAFLRLVGSGPINASSRAHFFALAGRVMRNVLINHALALKAAKRGGGAATLTIDAVDAAAATPGVDVLALDEALQRYAALDARRAQVVEHRFFGGMSVEETAEALGVSISTVEADWRLARAWLAHELNPS